MPHMLYKTDSDAIYTISCRFLCHICDVKQILMPFSFSCAPVSYPTLSMVRVCLPPLYGSCLPPIFTPSPTSILSFQNMIEFQLQRETPSSTMGFGFFEAGVGSLFVEYFQFCFPLESSVRIVRNGTHREHASAAKNK